MTFRVRLLLTATVAVAVAVALASLAAFFVARGALLGSVDQDLSSRASAAISSDIPGTLSRPEIEEDYALGMIVQVVQPGESYGSSGATGGAALPVGTAVEAVADGNAPGFFATVTSTTGQQVREVVEPIPGGGAFQLATSLQEVDLELGHLRLVLILVALTGIALAVTLGWLVAHAALIPLDELTSSVEDLAATTDENRRLSPGGTDELGRLRRAFNHLLEVVDSSRVAQRQLVLDASHELRTPLTSLRTNLEVVRRLDELPPGEREVLVTDVLAQLAELTTLVGDIEELAREGQRSAVAETFRLDHVAEEMVVLANVHGRPRGVTFTQALEPAWVHASRHRVTRAIGNLLDNALKWSPDGASVEITCTNEPAIGSGGGTGGGTGGGVLVVVRDHGPGIDPTDLPHVFDRFYRAPSARSLPGSGLGLAIVAQVVQEEGGSVSAANHPGGGAVFSLRLPAVRPLATADDPDR